jgi:hypothetical protein
LSAFRLLTAGVSSVTILIAHTAKQQLKDESSELWKQYDITELTCETF